MEAASPLLVVAALSQDSDLQPLVPLGTPPTMQSLRGLGFTRDLAVQPGPGPVFMGSSFLSKLFFLEENENDSTLSTKSGQSA